MERQLTRDGHLEWEFNLGGYVSHKNRPAAFAQAAQYQLYCRRDSDCFERNVGAPAPGQIVDSFRRIFLAGVDRVSGAELRSRRQPLGCHVNYNEPSTTGVA